MITYTKKQLEKFIKVRNKSSFHTNLQFEIDLDKCKINPYELGNPIKLHPNGIIKYVWDTPFGRLTEINGFMALEDYPENYISYFGKMRGDK